MEADVRDNWELRFEGATVAFFLFERIESTKRRDVATWNIIYTYSKHEKGIEIIHSEFLSKFSSIRIYYIKINETADKGEILFRLRNSKCGCGCCTWILLGCYFLVATKRISYSRKLHAVTRRITRLKRRKTAEKRRFETRSEGFRHRRCSLGILRESPLGQLYGKTAHTDRPICELR